MPAPASTPDLADSESARKQDLALISERIGPLVALQPSLKSLHDQLRAQGRDEAWASRSEPMIRREMAALLPPGEQTPPLAIHCGTTLCEVSVDLSQGPADVSDRFRRATQLPELSALMWGRGYHEMGTIYGPDAQERQSFVKYYRREAPVDVKVPRRNDGA